MRKRRAYKQYEERRHPDSPDGLVVAAAKNPEFGKKFAEEFKQIKARVKKDGCR